MIFQVNPLQRIHKKNKPYILRKTKVKIKMSSAAFLFGALRVKRRRYFGMALSSREIKGRHRI